MSKAPKILIERDWRGVCAETVRRVLKYSQVKFQTIVVEAEVRRPEPITAWYSADGREIRLEFSSILRVEDHEVHNLLEGRRKDEPRKHVQRTHMHSLRSPRRRFHNPEMPPTEFGVICPPPN